MLRRPLSSILVFMIVGILALTTTTTSRAGPLSRRALAPSPDDLINAVNALRTSYGLAPYSISPILMATAQGHADYMAATGHVSHTGVGGSSVTDRLLAAGYPLAGDLTLGGFRSENITSGNESKSAQDAVKGWTGDAPHLNTMISPNLTEIGAGISVNGGRVYFVIDCALPTTNGLPQPAAGTSIAAASTIVPGGGVIIPVVVVTPNVEGDVIHEVKAGQSLWQIAISYETKIDEIKRLNNLYDNEIYPGMKLLVRKDAAVPTLPAETATVEALVSPTGFVATSTIRAATLTVIASSTPVAASRNITMGVAIGIIALALLGGGVFVRLGTSKKDDSSTKE